MSLRPAAHVAQPCLLPLRVEVLGRILGILD
jgi:hypothetical protein